MAQHQAQRWATSHVRTLVHLQWHRAVQERHDKPRDELLATCLRLTAEGLSARAKRERPAPAKRFLAPQERSSAAPPCPGGSAADDPDQCWRAAAAEHRGFAATPSCTCAIFG